MRAAVIDSSHPDNVDINAVFEGENRWDDPVYYGFHCNGECWEQEPDFPRYRWMKDNPVYQTTLQWHNLPIVLHPMQDFINSIVFDHYRHGGGPPSNRGGNKHPAIIKWHGKYFVWNGTHRLAVVMSDGDGYYFGRYYDHDNPENKTIEEEDQS
jgi:hypothetical protein